MGWTSTGDPYANVGDAALSFDSEEAAKAFAEKHGWEYTVRIGQFYYLPPDFRIEFAPEFSVNSEDSQFDCLLVLLILMMQQHFQVN